MAFKMTRNKTMVGAAAAAAGIALAALTLTGSDLQTMINETPVGGVLTISGTYTGNFVINKAITIEGDAKLITPNADPVFNIPPNTRDVTLRGLTLTTTPGWATVHDLIRIGDQGEAQDTIEEAPTNITITHCKLSAQPDQNIQRGISANGANITITNTEIREIHARGYDTQAIGVWNGPGPFYIADNYLEGSGENVMFGGAAPSIKVGGSSVPNLTITGVKFIRNRVVKPLSWRGVWSVKNLFELKNCRDCFIDGNVFDGNWTDAQAGRAIVFTPRPSDSGIGAVVEDVVFSNNIVRNTGSGVLLLGHDEAPAPTDVRLKRVKVINNVFENVNGPQFGSNGVFVTVIAGTEDVVIANNTVFQTGNIISSDYDPSTRFTYRDNITKHNEYGIMGSGKSPGNSTIDYYFPGGTIAGNLIAQEVNAPGNVTSIYPAGNFFPATLAEVGFVDLAGGNYRLAASSAYKGKGTSGGDPGCDIDLLNAALGGNGTTPTPLPTASMTPSATPSASPQPSGVPSADGTKGPTIVDSQLAVWTLSPQPELRTLRNGAQAGGGQGKEYKYLSKVVYVAGLDSQWYRWTGSGWAWHSVTEPGGGTPTPTPTPVPSPTSQPLPSPSPSATPTPKPSPSPTPSLPVCAPNQLIGNPARCLCSTGARCTGGNARCL